MFSVSTKSVFYESDCDHNARARPECDSREGVFPRDSSITAKIFQLTRGFSRTNRCSVSLWGYQAKLLGRKRVFCCCGQLGFIANFYTEDEADLIT